MLDNPSGDSLLEAVSQFLRNEIMPNLDAADAFKTRIAANAIDLVVREMQGQSALNQAEREELAALLGHDGTPDMLNRELCAAISDRLVTAEAAGLKDYLWRSIFRKMAIEQPTYALYRRMMSGSVKQGRQP